MSPITELIGSAKAYGWGVITGPTGPFGSYESIATSTVGSSGATDITFSSIPGNYAHLQIRGIARWTAAVTSEGINAQFNADTASNYYPHHIVYGTGSGTGAYSNSGSGDNILFADATGSSAATSNFGVFIWDIFDYSNTDKFKTNRSIYGYDNNGSGVVALDTSHWRSKSAITSIKIFSGSGKTFAENTKISLYAIRGAAV